MDALFGKANESLNCNLYAIAQLLHLSRVVFLLLKYQLLIHVQVIIWLVLWLFKVYCTDNATYHWEPSDHIYRPPYPCLLNYVIYLSSAQIQSPKYMA